MKKMFMFLALIACIAISQQPLFGQTTRQERNQLNLLENEIANLQTEVIQQEKFLEREKHEVQFELWKELRRLEIQADPRRAASIDEIEWTKTEMGRIKLQIDSVESISSSQELEFKKTQLAQFQDQRDQLIQNYLFPDQSIPKEMGNLTKNRRQNSNVIRREELVLAKIENNIGGPYAAVDPNVEPTGYKVIFDNKYSLSTTFVLLPMNGGEKIAINLAPRSRTDNYILPGKYLVEFYVNGRRRDDLTSPLTIDGSSHSYEGESCFGFVFKSRY